MAFAGLPQPLTSYILREFVESSGVAEVSLIARNRNDVSWASSARVEYAVRLTTGSRLPLNADQGAKYHCRVFQPNRIVPLGLQSRDCRAPFVVSWSDGEVARNSNPPHSSMEISENLGWAHPGGASLKAAS